MAVQQSHHSGPLSLISCVSARESSPVDDVVETKSESKKKRFHPFRNLRRMFRRKSRQLDVADLGIADSDVDSSPHSRVLDPRSCSTNRLIDDETVAARRRSSSLAPGLSLSHDSVFNPDRTDSGHSSSDLENSSLSIPILIPTTPRFQAELADVIRRRARDDSDDEDLGLPRSRCSSATDYPDKFAERAGKSQSSCSEGSLLSTGSSLEDDLQASGEGSDLDLKVTRHKLSHSAAKHKMAVRPRRNHAPATKKQTKAGSSLPATPEVNEEVASWTPPTPTSSPEPAAAVAARTDTAPSVSKREKSTERPTRTLTPPKPERTSLLKPKTDKSDKPPVSPSKPERSLTLPMKSEKVKDVVDVAGSSPPKSGQSIQINSTLPSQVKTGLNSPTVGAWSPPLIPDRPAMVSSEPMSLGFPSNYLPETWSKSASLPHGAAISMETRVARSLSSAAASRLESPPQQLKEDGPKEAAKPGTRPLSRKSSEKTIEEEKKPVVLRSPTEPVDGSKSLIRISSSKLKDEEVTRVQVTKSLSRTADRRQRMDPIDIPISTSRPISSPPTPTWPVSMVPTARSISPPKAVWPENTQPERTGIFIKNERARRDSRESKPPIQKSHSFHKEVSAPMFDDKADDDSSRRIYLKNRRGIRKEDVGLSKKSTSLESIGRSMPSERASLPTTLPARSGRSASSDSVPNVIVTHEEPRYANLKNLLLQNFEQVHHGYENIEIIELVKKERESQNNSLEKPKIVKVATETPAKVKVPEPEKPPVEKKEDPECQKEKKDDVEKQKNFSVKTVPEFMKVQLRESRTGVLIERRKSEMQVVEDAAVKTNTRPFKKQTSLIEIVPVKEEAKVINKQQSEELPIAAVKEDVAVKSNTRPFKKQTSLIEIVPVKDDGKIIKKQQSEELPVSVVKEELKIKKQASIHETKETEKPIILVHPKPSDTMVIVDKYEKALVQEEVVLRRKSQTAEGDEPELMKVFARRSLKVKDYVKKDDGENARSRDSDKENDAVEPKAEERKKDDGRNSSIKPATPLKPAIAARNSLLKYSKTADSSDENKSLAERKNKINEKTKLIDKPTVVTIVEKIAKRPESRLPAVVIKEIAKDAVEKIELDSKKGKDILIENILDSTNLSNKLEDSDGPGFKTIQDRRAEWERRLQAAK